MDMVLVGVEGMDEQCRVFPHGFKQASFQFGDNVPLEDISTTLGAPDNVILVFVDAVVKASCSHELSLPQT